MECSFGGVVRKKCYPLLFSLPEMQTILGAGGVIGNGLASALPRYTDQIRLVSRNPQRINPGDEIFPADLTNIGHTIKAVKGSEVAYLTAGFTYNTEVWQKTWPLVMENVLEACKVHDVKLVFFDNMYCYGRAAGPINENQKMNPCSQKGEVRARIAEQMLTEIEKGNLQGIIVRSADFYGPGADNSLAYKMVFQKLIHGKKASWVCHDNFKHASTFTPDAVEATALLGNTPTVWNQIWHLPTDSQALTGKEFIQLTAELMNAPPGYSLLKPWMLKMVSPFNADARELLEMTYQYECDYILDSSKFEEKFYRPTGYQEGLKNTVNSLRSPAREPVEA